MTVRPRPTLGVLVGLLVVGAMASVAAPAGAVPVGDAPGGVDAAPAADVGSDNNTTTTDVASPISGVSDRKWGIATGGDGLLSRSDLVDVVYAYIRKIPLDGVEFERSEVVSIANFFLGVG